MRLRNGGTTILLCGEAGQGIKTLEIMLLSSLKLSRFNVYGTEEYMSRVRGGMNITEIRISHHRVRAFSSHADIVIPFHKGALPWISDRISGDTVIMGDSRNMEKEFMREGKTIEIPLTDIAIRAGSRLYINMVVGGLIPGLFDGTLKLMNEYILKRFMSKGKDVVDGNLRALEEGYALGKKVKDTGSFVPAVKKDPSVAGDIVISGTEAVALGAMAGGMNFLSFYPMSPSTGVAVFAAAHSEELGILVEQAEDEIAAGNMAIGAWYAGARAMVTTSGGGFSLMTEALSLAGMAEIPLVIHIAQRPGPATGLPTRTMQGDLNMALYAGHGEFPRIILAPGNMEQAFRLSGAAFNLAELFQVPVLILTDQYFVDTHYNIPETDLERIKRDGYISEAGEDYRRYILTEDGISPRAVPGNGKGVVIANGNEHDEWGDISEDKELNRKMQEKRAIKKMDKIRKHAEMPEIIGNTGAKNAVVSWGSTYHTVKEAVERLEKDVMLLHFSWVHPLPGNLRQVLEGKTIMSVEQNVGGQFADMLSRETGLNIRYKVLKYDGRPFSVEELYEILNSIMGGEDGR